MSLLSLLVSLAKGLPTSFISSKNHLSISLILCTFSFPFFYFLLWHKNILTTFIYYSLCVVAIVYKKKSGHNLWDLVLPFYYVGPKDQKQVIRLCNKNIYLLSHLTRLGFWSCVCFSFYWFWIWLILPAHPQALRCIIKLFIWIALILM